jgi:acyl-CoA thioesterase
VGRVDGEEILTVNAALGYRPDQPIATWAQPPTVPPPLASPARPIIDEHRGTLIDRIETRLALGRQGDELDGTHAHHGRSALWCRMPGGLDPSSASLAVLGDFMPSGIGFALGVNGGGTSLDNTIRVLHLAPTEWVLCDIEVYGVANGYGHGRAHLWAEDGTLLGTASQSVVVRRWDQ